MSLEEEALRARGPSTPPMPAAVSRRGDPLVRFLALLILVALLSAAFWVPLYFLHPIGAAVVLAGLTIGGAAIASRLRELRRRVDALEAAGRMPEPPPAALETPPDRPSEGQK